MPGVTHNRAGPAHLAVDRYHGFLLLGALAFGLVGSGIFLIVEHWLTWGYLEFELLGHETYGLIMILAGAVVFIIDWRKLGAGTGDGSE